MPRIREVSLVTRGRLSAGLVALVALVGVLLTPAVTEAAPAAARRTTTTTLVRRTTTTTVVQTLAAADVPTLAADAVPTLESAPGGQENAIEFPTINFPTFPNFPNIGQLLRNVLVHIQAILNRVLGNLCGLLGGSFCASP